ncbi:DNA internalization-related competence protein ComEC/Rec2 [Methylomonas sp. LL1]|uniref:DNA internalization-related competence protein ComEC/Rec2 n=1 Tax=Methylomonas sp. LL1 TaxID=2785785 RepID=UPI0018C42A15|nr:DNA internalization-related competence protein ComEC/Rec2 [Methylomonas sp. LL1]QPK65183.1 DNA internalization-related competence protein ComEC/Rec2 [Methylomonas sp. LL1]
MSVGVLAFVIGIGLVQQWSRLPSLSEWGVLVLMAAWLLYRRARLGWILLLGMLWAGVYAEWRVTDRLADGLQGRDVRVRGYVSTLPKQQDNRVSFDFIVTRADESVPAKLRLNWYEPGMSIKAGQAWELTVRLKQPHGLSNPGGFDYEAWLFANHIGATGYVRPLPLARPIDPPFAFLRYVASVRQSLSDRLDQALPEGTQLGVIKALTLGSQDLISRRQWDVYRATGIVHLMVISGSHISLIAGLVYFGIRRVWAWVGGLTLSPQNVAAVMAWWVSIGYVALAGFSIPTQRAMLMLTVGLYAIVRQRNTAPVRVLMLALLAVVLFDPLAVLAVGFWLSFAAVAVLIYISSGRLGRESYWRKVSKLHFAMAVGLAPLLILFFQQTSLISPLANWIAVPVIGLLVTPAALLAAGVALFSVDGAALLLWPIDRLLQCLEWLLWQMAAWPLATVACPHPPWYALGFAAVGVLLLLAPKGMPARYLSPVLFAPLIFVAGDRPKPGQFWLTLLDVGQGLAAVVRTEHHTLVFDTGARYSEQADMGESVILPYCRYQGINTIDTLVISHGDNDHSGGAAALMAGIPVGGVYSSVAQWAEQDGGRYCKAGQTWQWDGVDFKVLWPGDSLSDDGNDNSCVIKVGNARFNLLLTGDIGQTVESRLVEQYGQELASSILIAPHHGSKTSSSSRFLKQVDPQLVLISSGYLNRFGFPHRQVMQRYRKRKIRSFNSAEDGAISVKTNVESWQIELWRQSRKKYWMIGDSHW